MAFDDPELLAEFITESREHLADVEGQLLEIEAGGGNINVDLVNTVFRAVHSIKGAAGFLGLTTVNKLAHSLENVLGRMRNRDLTPTPAIVDCMLKAADALNKLIDDVEGSNGADVSGHVEALDRINAGEAGAAASGAAVEPAAPVAAPIAEPVAAAAVVAAEPAASASAIVPANEPTTAAATALASATAPAAANPAAASTQGPETSIRVQVSVLDSLMNLAGELVLGRNQLMQTLNAEGHGGIEARGGSARPGHDRAARSDHADAHAADRRGVQPVSARRSRPERQARQAVRRA